MATISHEPTRAAPERRRWSALLVPDMWVSLAIAVIWLSVLFDAIFGPDIVTNSVSGDSAVVPSVVVLAPLAFFATWVVARYGFRRNRTG